MDAESGDGLMAVEDFLVELGTEELPPRSLKTLAQAFATGLTNQLQSHHLNFGTCVFFATPRRLAVRVERLETCQPDRPVERKGPSLKAAFDADGQPTRAAEGFARSCGVAVNELETLREEKGAWLLYRSVQPGAATRDLLPRLVEQAVTGLPIAKRMRWGCLREEFVRPVHWLVMLLGQQVLDAQLLGQQAGRETRGHRFHCPNKLLLKAPADYEQLLIEQGKVIPDFARRQARILQQVKEAARRVNGEAVIDPALLEEVTALVEWPVALTGHFDQTFLQVPAEALISSMQTHQKYFPVVDAEHRLLPCFITVSNIESLDPARVVAGNEKVIRPRLADAAFFFATDKKRSLATQRESLKSVIFQARLGSVFDKTERVARLAEIIARTLGSETDLAQRAAMLSKADLVTEMVLEFPELQGIMGQHYASHDGESPIVAQALNEQYLPRFAGDGLPETLTGCALAIADKLDTLVGIFGIGQPPSGTRDPYGLRRAALGILRITVEKRLNLDLRTLIKASLETFAGQGIVLDELGLVPVAVLEFMLERFRAWYQSQSIAVEVFLAVRALAPGAPLDFDQRVKAVNHFLTLPEAADLAAANKRVSNILEKSGVNMTRRVNPDLLREPAEKKLAQVLAAKQAEVTPLLEQHRYTKALEALTELRESVDCFFDQVLVNTQEEAVRLNRLALLHQLRALFLKVADISLLQAG
jgi:glycyl-tRNA synthetase beta chain